MVATARRGRELYIDGMEILGPAMEGSLLIGRGYQGIDPQLRCLDDWRRHWDRWRDTLLLKVIEHRPGTRPLAQYVTGEIPSRPVLVEPPLRSRYLRLYVPDGDGGRWHRRLPWPFMRREVEHLYDLGIVDDEERRRHHEWQRQRRAAGESCPFGDWPWEAGRYFDDER